MTITKALKIARDRVSVIHYGNNDFVMQEWMPHLNATRESHHMDHGRVQAYAKEAKIRVALEVLDVEDAGAEANTLSQEEGRWDDLVRYFIKRKA